MKYVLRTLSIIISFTILGACAPDSRQEGSKATTTAEPARPTVVEEDGYRIARGATRIQDMSVNFDPATKSMRLRGKMEYLSVKGQSLENITVDLTGVLDSEGFIALKNHDSGGSSKAGPLVAAKATCLSEAGTCHSSFVDIYIYTEGVVYHHQIESHQEVKAEEKSESKQEDKGSEEEDLTPEGGADEVEGEPGQYVGTIQADIENILQVKPQIPAKKEEPKKEEPKKDVPAKPKSAASQAIGPVNAGRLENATNLLKYEQNHTPAGFRILRPERKTYFATNELAFIIAQMGQLTKQEVPGYVLAVGDLSRETGGRLGTHKSHQNGLDADVAFYFNNKSFQNYFASAVAVDKPHANWMVQQQWKLFKHVVNTQLIDRIFIHRTLKKALCGVAIQNGELQKGKNEGLAYETLRRLIADTDHHNHFHLRVKCSSAQVRCRQMAEPAPGSGCF